jgi:cell division transport system permease protein
MPADSEAWNEVVGLRVSFFVGEALASLRRNWIMTMASLITVLVTMTILGAVLVVDRNLNHGATNLKNRVEIEVFINDAVAGAPGQVAAMYGQILAMPAVRSCRYVTKAEALASFEKTLGSQGKTIVANLSGNPLPASFVIYVKDPSEVDRVAGRFFSDPRVNNDPGTTDGVSYAKATVRNLLGTLDLVGKGLWVVTALFAAAAVLLVSTTVRLSIFARRREVEVMQLVGATNWFIRWPFLLEGFITGILGSLLAAGAVWALSAAVVGWIHSSKLDFLDARGYPVLLQAGSWPLGLVPTLVLVGALLGTIGSALALGRHLRMSL